MGTFSVRVEPAPHTSIVHLVGDLDLATAPLLVEALRDLEGHVTFECSSLEFVDSSGLAIFASHAQNGGASITNASPATRKVLEITGLDRLQA